MFAEELSRNAGRKRAEEAKARRQRVIKAQQQQQQKTTLEAVGASPASTGSTLSNTAVVGSATSFASVGSISTMHIPQTNTVVSTHTSTSTFITSYAPTGACAGELSSPAPTVNGNSSSNNNNTTTTAAAAAKAKAATLPVLERAQQQRLIRAEAVGQQNAATTVQKTYRKYRSNQCLYVEQVDLLSKRLQDIVIVRDIMWQTKKVLYLTPPATITVLTRQLLYVTTKPTTYRQQQRWKCLPTANVIALFEKMVVEVYLPVVDNTDENINPFLVWLQSFEGRCRFHELLRLIVVSSTTKSSSILTTVLRFLSILLGTDQEKPIPLLIGEYCRSVVLFHKNYDTIPFSSSKTKNPPYAMFGASLNLIAILRYFLLFVVSDGEPIPPNAMHHREQSIAVSLREQAGALSTVIVQSIEACPRETDREQLLALLVTQWLTVPLFTWKLSSSALVLWTKMISNTSHDDTTSQSPVFLISVLRSFSQLYVGTLSQGRMESILRTTDLTLTSCPATPSQCLLANLLQMTRLCPAVNGMDAVHLHYDASTLLFQMITAVLQSIPLGTFSARESAVEWIDEGNGHYKPVVLSPIVIELCRALLLDSFVRRLFLVAIDEDFLRTDEILSTKDTKDLKHEQDLSTETSATALAAKEARIDRSRSFWNSSKWARKLTKGVMNLLGNDNSNAVNMQTVPKISDYGSGKLLNTSAMSREAAEGRQCKVSDEGDKINSAVVVLPRKDYKPTFLFALGKAYAVVLARWGGGGSCDLVQRQPRDRARGENAMATSSAEPVALALLNTLCFGTPLLKVIWGIIQSDQETVLDINGIIDSSKGRTPVRIMRIAPTFTATSQPDGGALLFMFASLMSHVLIVTDDIEIHDMERPLPLHQIRRCIQVFKKLLHRACCIDDASSSNESNYFGLALISSAARVMRDLYDRSSRRPLCAPKLWIVADMMDRDIRSGRTHDEYVALLSQPVLRICPFLVSFKQRLKLFERIVTTNRIDIQGVNDGNPFNTNPLKRGIPVRITRGRILEDGLATMNNLGRNMRQRISVNYYNQAGARESGVDAGGLFKEFWTDLCAVAFNPNYALFRVTEGAGNCMYPNPSSVAAHGSDHITLFEFLGRILGKALYEGITIHPRFAHFFLSFLRGDYNYLHMLPDLSTVDAQLYNNLMFLKNFDGDAQDLCLSFTVTVNDFGGTTEIPLIPNGNNVDVTNSNKHRYIGLVAKYYVVDRVKEQSEAFVRGLWEVIDRSWLRIFNEPELQVLISGASDGEIDVEDMRAHTRYTGGFTGIDRTVMRFWNVMKGFDCKQQGDLLRFVTSCERPPPLGFASMNPPFTIQRVGIMRDGDKLPSASTCFNTLKLPTYSSEKVLRERLLYAIQSGAGFELT